MKRKQAQVLYVLGSPQQDSTVAVLCRGNGDNKGPAVCESKKDAIKLKTKLSSDPRGQANQNAMAIINNLLIYKISSEHPPVWEEGSLWAYLPSEFAKCLESQNFWS